MGRGGVKVSLKAYSDANEEAGERKSGQRLPSRSRSRLPQRVSLNNSPIKDRTQDYRHRSKDRSIDKYQKSEVSKQEENSSQDIRLGNTSFNNPIKLPEYQEEQDQRGRSRESQNKIEYNADNQLDGDMDDMVSLMGFDGFSTTKGKQVKGAKGGGVKKEKKSEYRQYMNRKKGFNRPLSPGR